MMGSGTATANRPSASVMIGPTTTSVVPPLTSTTCSNASAMPPGALSSTDTMNNLSLVVAALALPPDPPAPAAPAPAPATPCVSKLI
jgi:hypothetical protein